MFGKRYPLFKLFGFEIRIDSSWFLLAVLITWSLATGYFPSAAEGLTEALYWGMGVAGALGLFASIIGHELAHALVARRFGVEMEGITLFLFGGVAEMKEQPPSPKAEAAVAIAGPVASALIAGVFFAVALVVPEAEPAAAAVLSYLAGINLVLAIFNLLPAFPLDGGRILRAVLWGARGNLRWASQVSSRVGSGFGVALIVLGLASALLGDLTSGIWWFILGIFLRGAARMSYQQVLLRQALDGETVRRFMSADPVTVQRSMSIRELVENFVYQHHFQMYPVVDGERLLGCVSTTDIQRLPRDEWDSQTVGVITQPCTESNTIGPATDAMEALAIMRRENTSRLLVMDDGKLLGVLTLKDLLSFFSSKIALGDLADDARPGK